MPAKQTPPVKPSVLGSTLTSSQPASSMDRPRSVLPPAASAPNTEGCQRAGVSRISSVSSEALLMPDASERSTYSPQTAMKLPDILIPASTSPSISRPPSAAASKFPFSLRLAQKLSVSPAPSDA
ncbi:hypothetical protein D3C71_1390160 [compost metagenome]